MSLGLYGLWNSGPLTSIHVPLQMPVQSPILASLVSNQNVNFHDEDRVFSLMSSDADAFSEALKSLAPTVKRTKPLRLLSTDQGRRWEEKPGQPFGLNDLSKTFDGVNDRFLVPVSIDDVTAGVYCCDPRTSTVTFVCPFIDRKSSHARIVEDCARNTFRPNSSGLGLGGINLVQSPFLLTNSPQLLYGWNGFAGPIYNPGYLRYFRVDLFSGRLASRPNNQAAILLLGWIVTWARNQLYINIPGLWTGMSSGVLSPTNFTIPSSDVFGRSFDAFDPAFAPFLQNREILLARLKRMGVKVEEDNTKNTADVLRDEYMLAEHENQQEFNMLTNGGIYDPTNEADRVLLSILRGQWFSPYDVFPNIGGLWNGVVSAVLSYKSRVESRQTVSPLPIASPTPIAPVVTPPSPEPPAPIIAEEVNIPMGEKDTTVIKEAEPEENAPEEKASDSDSDSDSDDENIKVSIFSVPPFPEPAETEHKHHVPSKYSDRRRAGTAAIMRAFKKRFEGFVSVYGEDVPFLFSKLRVANAEEVNAANEMLGQLDRKKTISVKPSFSLTISTPQTPGSDAIVLCLQERNKKNYFPLEPLGRPEGPKWRDAISYSSRYAMVLTEVRKADAATEESFLWVLMVVSLKNKKVFLFQEDYDTFSEGIEVLDRDAEEKKMVPGKTVLTMWSVFFGNELEPEDFTEWKVLPFPWNKKRSETSHRTCPIVWEHLSYNECSVNQLATLARFFELIRSKKDISRSDLEGLSRKPESGPDAERDWVMKALREGTPSR